MTFALLYWILMLLWLVFGIYRSWPNIGLAHGGDLLLFILLLILGWKVFGAPIRTGGLLPLLPILA
jgi:hypothetical protein